MNNVFCILATIIAAISMQSSAPITKTDSTIGSPDEKWEKFQSGEKVIYVRMNGFYYSKPNYPGFGFRTYVVTNLQESTIVGAPQSVVNEVEGNCQTLTFHVIGSLFFSGKDRSGDALKSLPPEEVERRLVRDSPFEKAFTKLCEIAKAQK